MIRSGDIILATKYITPALIPRQEEETNKTIIKNELCESYFRLPEDYFPSRSRTGLK